MLDSENAFLKAECTPAFESGAVLVDVVALVLFVVHDEVDVGSDDGHVFGIVLESRTRTEACLIGLDERCIVDSLL